MSTDLTLGYFLQIGGQEYIAARVTGREAVCKPFRFEVRLSEVVGLDPDAVVHSQATLRLVRETENRHITGLVTDIRIGAEGHRSQHALVVLEPTMALARLRQDIRVFRNKTTPQIVTEVLAHYGLSPDWRLRGSYPSYPYTVQWRESDFDFVSRLLELEGIFYFFGDDDSVVMGDSPAAWDSLSGGALVPFRAASGLDRNDDAVISFSRASRLRAGKVTLRDFNPETPSLDMEVAAPGPWDGGPEFYDFPGEYAEPDEGKRRARVIAESMAVEAHTRFGRSLCTRFVPGARFELLDAPNGNSGGYAILSVSHAWEQEQEGFVVAFEALPDDVPYRPSIATSVPTMPNPVTGFVTGPPGSDIHCDEYGRVKVHFHWDRLQPYDDDCSHWIPMMQNNTGSSSSIPRVGWEVLCHFLEGDPDRPVCLGRVYNERDPHHLILPEQKTRSQIKSLSSPRMENRNATGTNEIIFEDFAGKEFINVHAEKDQNILVGNDKTEHVMHNESTIVDNDEAITIGNDEKVDVGTDMLPIVRRHQSWNIGANASYTVGKGQSFTVDGNRVVTIGGQHFRRIGTFDAHSSNVLHETVGGVILDTCLKGHTTTAMNAGVLAVGGAIVELAKEEKSETYGLARTELVGGLVFSKAGSETQFRSEKARATTVGGALSITSQKEMSLAAEDLMHHHAMMALYQGSTDITLKVGETTVAISGGTIAMKTGKKVSFKVSGANEQLTGEANLIEG